MMSEWMMGIGRNQSAFLATQKPLTGLALSLTRDESQRFWKTGGVRLLMRVVAGKLRRSAGLKRRMWMTSRLFPLIAHLLWYKQWPLFGSVNKISDTYILDHLVPLTCTRDLAHDPSETRWTERSDLRWFTADLLLKHPSPASSKETSTSLNSYRHYNVIC